MFKSTVTGQHSIHEEIIIGLRSGRHFPSLQFSVQKQILSFKKFKCYLLLCKIKTLCLSLGETELVDTVWE
jgi:hypothetical protein